MPEEETNKTTMYESEILSLYKFANIKKFPVDLNSIVSALGYRVKTYQETAETEDQMIWLKKISGDAFVVRKNKTIYINDSASISEKRKRFSIAHEIGHIVLLTDDEDKADEFASNLLVPRPVIYALGLMKATQISEYFQVSVSAANNVLSSIKRPHVLDYFPDIYGADMIDYFGFAHLRPELFPGRTKPVRFKRSEAINLFPPLETETTKEEEAKKKERVKSLQRKCTRIYRKIISIDVLEKGYEEKYQKYQKQLWEAERELNYLTDKIP